MVAVGASNVGMGSVWSGVVVVVEGLLVDWLAVVASFGILVDASVALGLAVSLVDGVSLVVDASVALGLAMSLVVLVDANSVDTGDWLRLAANVSLEVLVEASEKVPTSLAVGEASPVLATDEELLAVAVERPLASIVVMGPAMLLEASLTLAVERLPSLTVERPLIELGASLEVAVVELLGGWVEIAVVKKPSLVLSRIVELVAVVELLGGWVGSAVVDRPSLVLARMVELVTIGVSTGLLLLLALVDMAVVAYGVPLIHV
jgi:hypothetical protein